MDILGPSYLLKLERNEVIKSIADSYGNENLDCFIINFKVNRIDDLISIIKSINVELIPKNSNLNKLQLNNLSIKRHEAINFLNKMLITG